MWGLTAGIICVKYICYYMCYRVVNSKLNYQLPLPILEPIRGYKLEKKTIKNI